MKTSRHFMKKRKKDRRLERKQKHQWILKMIKLLKIKYKKLTWQVHYLIIEIHY